IVRAYRNAQKSRFAKFMLSRGATWLALSLMAVVGIVLGLQRVPATTSWCVVVAILFVLTHLSFVILRGWRVNGKIRLRFVLTHVGLWLALGAGFWGAPDREQLRLAVDYTPTNEAYTMQGALTLLPYEIGLEELTVERNEQGVATNYEARVKIADESVSLRVNHPYNRTLSQKIYLASVKDAAEGDIAILEIVNEPWQWFSMAGIVMLILGGLLLFLRGPQRDNKIVE
ncbi:MAG: cytochrome c biogenesis protein ResB, partial [Alistipes sp.]|nr:cytochrome c biogenesis protein ResB [Alistipes sp.]